MAFSVNSYYILQVFHANELKNGVKNLQTTGYNEARTVFVFSFVFVQLFLNEEHLLQMLALVKAEKRGMRQKY